MHAVYPVDAGATELRTRRSKCISHAENFVDPRISPGFSRYAQLLGWVVKRFSLGGSVLRALSACGLMIVLTSGLMAQSADPEPATRAEQIEMERMEKAAKPQPPPPPSRLESSVDRLGTVLRRVPIGVEVLGLGPGAGVALTSELDWKKHHDQIVASAWGTVLLHGFFSTGTGLEYKNIGSQRLDLALAGSYSHAPQLEYYGPGPDSSIHDRTDYLREETLFDFRSSLTAHRHFEPGCHVAELLVNVGPGTSDDLATTQSKLGPAQAPGIDVQSNFLITGCSAQTDFRDNPLDPHKGIYAAFRFENYDAQKADVFSFNRLSTAAEAYVPFFNKKRVIALLGNAEWNFHEANQVVPFYLQPTLGGDTELRGFRRYRFYDENKIALTAEYRWEISSGFDMALFFDSGKVFHSPGQMSFSSMDTSAGFGLRFKNGRGVVARLDTGFSREGVQVWLRTSKLF
jgi:hypothetical protein